MAQYMSQVPPGVYVWVTYNEYRGGPYLHAEMRVIDVDRVEIEPGRTGNRRYRVSYIFSELKRPVPCTRCFLSEAEAKECAEKLNAKKGSDV